MNVIWVPVIIICLSSTPKNECTETTPNATVLKAEAQSTPMACMMAAMGRYASFSNSPQLGEPLSPRFICREQHTNK